MVTSNITAPRAVIVRKMACVALSSCHNNGEHLPFHPCAANGHRIHEAAMMHWLIGKGEWPRDKLFLTRYVNTTSSTVVVFVVRCSGLNCIQHKEHIEVAVHHVKRTDLFVCEGNINEPLKGISRKNCGQKSGFAVIIWEQLLISPLKHEPFLVFVIPWCRFTMSRWHNHHKQSWTCNSPTNLLLWLLHTFGGCSSNSISYNCSDSKLNKLCKLLFIWE